MSNGTSAPIQWQSSQLWIGPTYAGGMYYYISFPGPDVSNPSYLATKQLPGDLSGLPAPPDMPYGPWNTLSVSAALNSTLRWRFINNGASWQLDGGFGYPAGLAVNSAALIGTLPAQLLNMGLPQNSLVMTNAGGITGAYANFEIQASPPGTMQITPRLQIAYSATIQGIYALNTPAPVGGAVQLGSFPTLTAAMAACQNDVDPPIPFALHQKVGY